MPSKQHSIEELRSAAIDVLAGREHVDLEIDQFAHLKIGVASVFERREGTRRTSGYPELSPAASDSFLEVFWNLFREGIITLGINNANREFPFFRLSQAGKNIVSGKDGYFFHDATTYKQQLTAVVPDVDPTTLIYVQEALQAFYSGCVLAATVMIGVATEHTFLLLAETIDDNPAYSTAFAKLKKEQMIHAKVEAFRKLMEPRAKDLPHEIAEDLDTNFAGILSIIRNFRNQSGHPSGKIIDREQVWVLLHLFIPYCKKMYQLRDHFKV